MEVITDSSDKPALTPAEWTEVLPHLPVTGGATTWGVHGTAAIELYGQPFGFTWDDVDAINKAAATIEQEWCYDGEHGIRNIARRIAALLPPR